MSTKDIYIPRLDKHVEVLHNPSGKELHTLMRSSEKNSVRFVAGPGEIVFADAFYLLHHELMSIRRSSPPRHSIWTSAVELTNLLKNPSEDFLAGGVLILRTQKEWSAIYYKGLDPPTLPAPEIYQLYGPDDADKILPTHEGFRVATLHRPVWEYDGCATKWVNLQGLSPE